MRWIFGISTTSKMNNVSRSRLLKSLLVFFLTQSCQSISNQEKELEIHDILLDVRHEHEFDRVFDEIGLIDITALTPEIKVNDFHPKLARSRDSEVISFVLLDKNGNGQLNDYNVDIIAVVPNNWSTLNYERFARLNFVPLKINQSFYLYDQYFSITDFRQNRIILSSAKPKTDFVTFPYILPSLTRTTINGETLDFRKLIDGEKLIYLEFWGTWCGPCVAQIPDIKELNNRFGDQITIVGISGYDELTKLKDFIAKNEMDWQHIQLDDEIERSMGIIKLFPLGVLFDQDGRLIRYGIKPKEIIEILSRNR